ncbi:MAG: RnfABCDGE type electron transport complex subunit G [Nitrospirae bacterium]|nr:RnfABCDGE type electron transport complex subunit G [Nitrospirota bacterium]MBI3606167.1 RnfABCDGE type electron transport complex subunit G [Nitrospirota bacterium]
MKGINKLVIALTAVCLGTALILGGIYAFTRDTIEKQKREKKIRSLKSVLPPTDNEIDKDYIEIDGGKDRRGNPVKVILYHGKKEGQLVGTAFSIIAHDGYSGDIEIMMGVAPDKTITGIEIISQKETPGLGDKILKEKWRSEFKGKSLESKTDKGIPFLDVKKDGGGIDQFSGATITPRAVVKAVREGLKIYERASSKS